MFFKKRQEVVGPKKTDEEILRIAKELHQEKELSALRIAGLDDDHSHCGRKMIVVTVFHSSCPDHPYQQIEGWESICACPNCSFHYYEPNRDGS
jgi:hypothetical protein